MKRLLLIIDPQVDFITGTLPVPGAEPAMTALASYVADNPDHYAHIIVSADRHPFRHFSFAENGGPWPRHCVHDSVGAAVWPPLLDTLCLSPVPSTFLYKGQKADVEEYSIFQNKEAAGVITSIIRNEGIDAIDICGLAGDVCVAQSLSDALAIPDMPPIRVLCEFAPSLDGGTKLNQLIADNHLEATI